MELIETLERAIGGRWYGVTFFGLNVKCKEEFLCPHVDRFCEAFNLASINKVLLDPCQFTCPGARYVFGCDEDLKEEILKKWVTEKGYSSAYATDIVEDTPHCKTRPGAIGINIGYEPNVLITKAQPEQVMRLIDIYQKQLKKSFRTEISSVMSACGNATVRALQTGDMAISFGCKGERKDGNLSRDRLFVALPYSLATDLLEETGEKAHKWKTQD